MRRPLLQSSNGIRPRSLGVLHLRLDDSQQRQAACTAWVVLRHEEGTLQILLYFLPLAQLPG
jgi:hypothetical protein